MAGSICATNVEWDNVVGTQSLVPASICLPQSLVDLVRIVRDAEAAGRSVHAFGSKWSFSDCAITADTLVDTRLLNSPLQTVQNAASVTDPALLYHVEAGMTIRDLYTHLQNFTDPATYKPRPLAAETLGGSSGQTLAGAISTGTHGGDYWLGPLADSVLAVHLVGPGGTQYWLEPSRGITDPSLLARYVAPSVDPANVIYDDSLFDSVLVSMGSMGIIYAVVLRVRDQYTLIENTTQTTWHGFLQHASGLLNDPNTRFLQVLVDPYADNAGDHNCLVTTRTEGAHFSGAADCSDDPTGYGQCRAGDLAGPAMTMLADLAARWPAAAVDLGVSAVESSLHGMSPQSVADAVGAMIDAILRRHPEMRPGLTDNYWGIVRAEWPPRACGGLSYCVMDTSLRNPGTPRGYSIEMFFQAIDTNGRTPFADFMKDALSLINGDTSTFLAGYVAVRFTQSTRACLGMQQWTQTCSIEIAALPNIVGELDLLANLIDLMYKHGGLPHWGQLLDFNRLSGGSMHVQGHGALYSRYPEWRRSYARLSDNLTHRTFANSLSDRWFLTSPAWVTTGSDPAETQYMLATSDAHLGHAIRSPVGGWSGLGRVDDQFSIPGSVSTVAAASAQPGEAQYLFATSDGHLWHTQRRPDATWSGLGDVNAAFMIAKSVTAVSAASSSPGETQFMFATQDGHLWHTLRRPDGSWTGLGDVNAVFAIPGPVAAVAAAYDGLAGETQFMFTTQDGRVWHTLRRPDGSWSGLGDLSGSLATSAPVVAVAATGDRVVPG